MASAQTHSQFISADVQSTVSVDEQAVSVEQRITFQVAYEPVDSLTLLVPRSLQVDALSATMDAQPIAINAPRSELFPFADQRVVRVPLPSPRIGRLDLQLRYGLGHEKPAPALTRSISVPLVMPGMGKLGHNQLRVVPQAGILAALGGGPWVPDGNAATTVAGLQLAAPTAVAELGLAAGAEATTDRGENPRRIWLDPHVAGRRSTAGSGFVSLCEWRAQLRLALPADAKADSLEILLDEKPVAIAPDAAGEFVVPLTPGDGEEHLLDVSYSFPRHLSTGRLLAEPPEILPTPRVNLVYWELIMPATDHLLLAPADFTGEYSWIRSGLLWYRQPGIDQAKLESLLRVPNPSPPSAQVNRYLFSTVGMVPALNVWWVPRSAGLRRFGGPAGNRPGPDLLSATAPPRDRADAGRAGSGRHADQSGNVDRSRAGWPVGHRPGRAGRCAGPAHVAAPVAPAPRRCNRRRAAARGPRLDRSMTEAYFRASRNVQPSTATAPAVPASPESQP